ncbi:uncharacterized protein KNAG_0C03350 [Huiozyma naganishii CBS 8797]|uniref:MSP domain-containing protein n=1 Tax=Huiozyma naganishii (strain ATCC MYA-139 / BCRC 22969 / CBS 8797 / KCTC 17520 / NBRC 10181 / NCYC 3082 / Yp74L-3) TaxID=1071383 RepID=J7RWQ1_HUIN7|nr:hypothetical protein KNAG_0C03350 [Kazachstania naganishii CBS 8797]CCK69442.1 hypothetical protein KNAG_0C03350 [Kazachstania naganishii CBS 8797]
MSQVDITPDVLEYKPPLTEQSTEYVTISNGSDEAIAFKVKTTAPKFYCVRPNAAVVAAGETVQVQVIFLGLPESPAKDAKCRDKFLVITLPAPYDLGEKAVAEAWSDLETEFGKQAVSKKIKVKYGHVAALVEGITGKSETAEDNKKEQNSRDSQVANAEEDEEEEEPKTAVEERQPLAREQKSPKVVKEEKTSASTGNVPEDNKESKTVANAGSNIVPIALVVILALVIRWYFF